MAITVYTHKVIYLVTVAVTRPLVSFSIPFSRPPLIKSLVPNQNLLPHVGEGLAAQATLTSSFPLMPRSLFMRLSTNP